MPSQREIEIKLALLGTPLATLVKQLAQLQALNGEWEVPVASAKLSLEALKSTPWKKIDPDGKNFPVLGPIFVTSFKRNSWLIPGVNGSLIELSLDIGHIVAGPKRTPVCELELELMAGQPAALFELAYQIYRTVAVMLPDLPNPWPRSSARRYTAALAW
jgi:hypothetical protein